MSCTVDMSERDFHDRWAEQTPISEVRVRDAFENITALENRFISRLMGDLRGLRILDIGAGLGEASVYFASQGATVTTNDISPRMLERCMELATTYGVTVTPVVGSSSGFDFGDGDFDIVYGANVLHHIGDIRPFLVSVRRALVPGGRFYFFDPLAYNPVINVYRRLAAGVRTDDERPLRFSHLKIFNEIFGQVHHKEFWLASLLLFLKYYFVDRIDPNVDRYWKRILREDAEKIGWWFRPLTRVDDIILRIPVIRYLAWNIVIWGRR